MRYHNHMKVHQRFLNPIVAALSAVFLLTATAFADEPLDGLFDKLKSADSRAAARLEREIWNEWSKSGSAAMDLLLQRGRDALAAGNPAEAIDHLTALTDHAPDFAEGWNARATAYYQARQFGPSVSDIARTLTLNPRHFGAMAGLGAIYEELNNPQKALDIYRAALAIHPNLRGVSESAKRLEAKVAGTDL
ncbi:MAG: tetratricopeptide repeat protein [Pseudotabrizicola sp.]|uniref:tetratricopeptide repeat protein n=2 Tax=Pseudotabrizicola sp. TaxID=2939647 RepID=UPI00271D4CFD|nr:tetratricopeptide repeat protein [Pseudotabrizicola sp.]MDO8884738.1 tetratricopeptide repeat protein [Pseudotabrizicola sp.]MDZ7574500.1 tetratricopeptide repeat protein [Pseudotabrizicola sp.]